MKDELIIIYTLIAMFLFILLAYKILGTTSLPELVEKDGYCKTTLGKDFHYVEDNWTCRKGFGENRIEKTFTPQEFREVCPKNKFFSARFLEDCFLAGDSRG